MVTKEQEREILKNIRLAMAGADPEGYIAAAFDGCCDLAESNIENDFCISYRQELQAEQEKSAKLAAELKDAKEAARSQKRLLDSASSAVPDLEETRILQDVVSGQMKRLQARMEESARNIVRLAENPADPEFTSEVIANRTAAAELKRLQGVLDRLDTVCKYWC